MQLCRPYIYVLLTGIMVVNLILAGLTRAEIALETAWGSALIAASLAGLLWSRRKTIAQSGRITLIVAALLETLMLILMLVLALRYLDHITKVSAIPLADPMLAAADAALGLNWVAYWEWIHDHTALHSVLIYTYTRIELASILIVVALFVIGQGRQARILLETLVICGILSVVIGTFFPAIGSVAYYLDNPASYENFAWMPGVFFVDTINNLRDPALNIRIGTDPMVGLTTMPSMHTATAIAMIALTFRTWLALPTMAFAIPMLIATPVWGGHYFVDVIAGTVMALAVGALVTRSFRPRPAPSDAADTAGALPA